MHYQQTPWKNDPRSKKFDHDILFGTTTPLNLPKTLGRPRGPVLDQGQSLRCTGYASAANGWYIHGQLINPDWQAAKIGQIQGRSVDESGGDPNATMKSMRDYGFLPQTVSNKSWHDYGIFETGWKSWERAFDAYAAQLDNISGFVKVSDRSQDTFDSIRSALFQAYDPVTKKGAGVNAFGRWLHGWNTKYIPTAETPLLGYHAYLFIDWDGEYLIAQNSAGEEYGDRGYLYFPREVVNREFSQRGTSLKILKTLTPEQVALAKQETPYGRIQRLIIQAWSDLSDKFGRV